MGRRRKARESALQLLFQLEFDDSDPQDIIRSYWKPRKVDENIREYCNWLVKGVIENRDRIDDSIQSASRNWRLSRMAIVDRNILRIAVFEILFEKQIVPPIVIDEAIEIAKKYGGREAASFVNGVLDAVTKGRKEQSDMKVKEGKKTIEEKENG